MAVSNNILKIHKKYFHMDEKFACGICGHQESRKQNLEKHNIILPRDIKYNCKQIKFNPISAGGGGVFRTPSNFAAFGDPLKVKYIEMFHAEFSYISIY